jgi:heptosyltransferase III
MTGARPSSLVYHSGALGDFVTCLPAIDAWRRAHPGSRMVLLGRPANAALADFDEVWDAGAQRFAPLFSPDGPAGTPAAELAAVDRALLFCLSSSPLTSAVRLLGAAEVVRQDPFPPPGSGSHVVDYHLSLFPQALLKEEDCVPRLALADAAGKQAAAALAAVGVSPGDRPPVLLHPGSGSPRKNWPLLRFLELASRLRAAGERVIWIVGPAEAGFHPPAEDAVLVGSGTAYQPVEAPVRGWHPRAAALSLPAVAAALGTSLLFVGNDSGVAHVAAAAGARCVALFGPTDPAVWAPRGRHVRVIKAPGAAMNKLQVSEVWRECARLLAS